jgi:hypothetical protein
MSLLPGARSAIFKRHSKTVSAPTVNELSMGKHVCEGRTRNAHEHDRPQALHLLQQDVGQEVPSLFSAFLRDV